MAEDDEGIDRWNVLDHLGALVDKSLVPVEGELLPCCRLLETTRLFALERLIDGGETASMRSRHLDHLLALAEPEPRTATPTEASAAERERSGRQALHDPAAMPADREAHTASGRYLSGRQAEDLDAALRGSVVWVTVTCCGAHQREMAILTAYGLQATLNLGDDAPFLVRGRNLREAAKVADRLTRAGMRRVVLVTS